MFDALHPEKSQMMSHSEYIQYTLTLNFTAPNDAPSARCPVCKRQMKVRAGHQKDDGHFYHNDNLNCPTKDPASRPYLGLSPRRPDPSAEQANRTFAKEKLELIYTRLHDIAPHLDFKEFIQILKEARRLNVYGYANLNPAYLPYVYVTLINFLPSASYQKRRELKFCFFYESAIKTYEDLWIHKGFSSRLVRISYREGICQKTKEVETSTTYLLEESATLSEKQRKWCLDVM